MDSTQQSPAQFIKKLLTEDIQKIMDHHNYIAIKNKKPYDIPDEHSNNPYTKQIKFRQKIIEFLKEKNVDIEHIDYSMKPGEISYDTIKESNLYTYICFHGYYPSYAEVKNKKLYLTNICSFIHRGGSYFHVLSSDLFINFSTLHLLLDTRGITLQKLKSFNNTPHLEFTLIV